MSTVNVLTRDPSNYFPHFPVKGCTQTFRSWWQKKRISQTSTLSSYVMHRWMKIRSCMSIVNFTKNKLYMWICVHQQCLFLYPSSQFSSQSTVASVWDILTRIQFTCWSIIDDISNCCTPQRVTWQLDVATKLLFIFSTSSRECLTLLMRRLIRRAMNKIY